jgi:hypothetical protein
VGGLVAVASPGRAEAKFVAAPVVVGFPSASLRGVQAAGRAGPMMAADTQDGVDYLLPGRREARAMMIETGRRIAPTIRAVM